MLHDVVKWRKVLDPRVLALPEGAVMRAVVGQYAVCFARTGAGLFAVEDRCPHQGKSFAGGHCENGYLICPWHRMHFDPATGRNRGGSTANVPTYPLEERADGLYIGMPGTSLYLFGIRWW